LRTVLAALSYDPIVHIEIGPLSISPHGVGIALGFLLGARLMLPAARRQGITEDDVYALLTRAAIGAIIGARVAYVINHVGDYDSILEVFKIWEGGISLLGGFVGAVAAALPEMRKRRLSFWKVMDAAAPGMALGVVIGRVGDLIVADHLGKPTDFFLGYRCPPPGVDTASPCNGTVVFQPALIDLLLTAVLLVVLLRLRRSQRWDGFLICMFTAWYGIARIIEDFMRIDETHGTGLTGSQWTSVVAVLLSVTWLVFGRRTPGWGQWDDARDDAPVDGQESPDEPPTMASQPEGEE
jgi:phosphatidylglycerol:prolipoprotein diacylglycerol transferase